MKPKHLWIGGWAIPKKEMEKLATQYDSDCDLTIVVPTQQALNLSLYEYDQIHAYSLGTLILFKILEIQATKAPLNLYAPILSFCREDQNGGTVSKTQLKLLQRQLKSKPIETLNEFYKSAQLPYRAKNLPYNLEDLIWGIEYLRTQSVNLETIQPQIGTQFNFIIGDQDRLLDVQKIKEKIPQIQIKVRATHALESLLKNI